MTFRAFIRQRLVLHLLRIAARLLSNPEVECIDFQCVYRRRGEAAATAEQASGTNLERAHLALRSPWAKEPRA